MLRELPKLERSTCDEKLKVQKIFRVLNKQAECWKSALNVALSVATYFNMHKKKHEPTSTDKQLLHLHRRHSVVAGLQSHHLATTNRWTATRGQHGPAQALVAEQVRVGLDPVSRPRLRIHPSASPRVKHYLGLLADERKDLLNVVATWSKERLYTQMLVLCHKSKNHI